MIICRVCMHMCECVCDIRAKNNRWSLAIFRSFSLRWPANQNIRQEYGQFDI